MATGRTVQKYSRIYMGSYGTGDYPSQICAWTRSYGPLTYEYAEVDGTAMCDSMKGYLPGDCTVSPGRINAMFGPTSGTVNTGIYPGGNNWEIGDDIVTQIVLGIRAEPILGDPVFGGIFPFKGMQYADDGGLVTATFDFGAGWSGAYPVKNAHPWGQLLHPWGEETGANTATGADWGNASTNGGLMLLSITNASGSATTFKVQHADTNLDGSFADLTGAEITIGTENSGSYYAIVAPGTTVNRYLRWQMTTDTQSFVMSFIRG